MIHKMATVIETRRYDNTYPRHEVTLDCAPLHARTIHLDSLQRFA